jgi:hypothetical protein
MTRQLAAVVGFGAFMLALAANAADIRLRCEMKGGGISHYTISDLTVRVDQPSGDTLTLPVEETPTQFRFPTQDGPIIINRVTGELFLPQDIPASGLCAHEPTKF